MTLRNRLKQCATLVGAAQDGRRILHGVRQPLALWNSIKGRLFRRRRTVSYLGHARVRKLQIGAGPNRLDGWLCSDIDPQLEGAVYLDARERFPFEDGVFDYVYSEHMIEHLAWRDGLAMLGECRRILKPGGTLRVATPDLKVLAGLYAGAGDDIRTRYVRWVADTFLGGARFRKPGFVVNNAFRRWGHQFLYDAEVLLQSMSEAGFVNLRRCAPGESGDPNLRGIERHTMGDRTELVLFETMVCEGDRPA